MRLTRRTAIAVLLAVTALIIPASATAQPQVHGAVADIAPLGTVFSADVVRDLPLGDNAYALLETTQSEVISDRFNSGGLNVGGDSRAGGFLGSWSQTLFRIGDINVSDPLGRGSAMLFPDTTLWQNVNIATGLMPADVNTPGLAVTLDPPRAGASWTRVFSGSGSGGQSCGRGSRRAAQSDRSSGLVRARLCSVQRTHLATTQPRRSRSSAAAPATAASNSPRPITPPDPASRIWCSRLQRAASGECWGGCSARRCRSRTGRHSRSRPRRRANTSVHVQSTFEQRSTDAARWRVFGGFTQRDRTNDLGSPTTLRVERITDGPLPNAVESAADDTVRRLSLGARYAPYRSASARHRLAYGADVDTASTALSDAFAGTARETVNGIPARVWTYAVPAAAESNRRVLTATAYASDVMTLADALTLDAGLRAELVHGNAEGAAASINWLSLLPHAYLRWQLGTRRALIGGYARARTPSTRRGSRMAIPRPRLQRWRRPGRPT